MRMQIGNCSNTIQMQKLLNRRNQKKMHNEKYRKKKQRLKAKAENREKKDIK